MLHPHCSLPARRIADARAAIAALPVMREWERDAMLYELDDIARRLGEISADHYLKESS